MNEQFICGAVQGDCIKLKVDLVIKENDIAEGTAYHPDNIVDIDDFSRIHTFERYNRYISVTQTVANTFSVKKKVTERKEIQYLYRMALFLI